MVDRGLYRLCIVRNAVHLCSELLVVQAVIRDCVQGDSFRNVDRLNPEHTAGINLHLGTLLCDHLSAIQNAVLYGPTPIGPYLLSALILQRYHRPVHFTLPSGLLLSQVYSYQIFCEHLSWGVLRCSVGLGVRRFDRSAFRADFLAISYRPCQGFEGGDGGARLALNYCERGKKSCSKKVEKTLHCIDF